MRFPYRDRKSQAKNLPEVVSTSPHEMVHDNDLLAKVLKAILSRPYQYHLAQIYTGQGRYAYVLSINGEVTVDALHGEAVKRTIEKVTTTEEAPPAKAVFASTFPAQAEESEED